MSSVLILEYDAILCDLLNLVLHRNGFNPIICKDPMFIRKELIDQHPDAMIIDSRLLYENGIDLLHSLKDENLIEKMYVMVLSSLGFSCIVKQAIDAGADDFMVKPVDMDLLVYKLKSFQKESIKKVLSTELVDSL